MKDSNSQKSNGGAGVGFFGLLQLLFIALKLMGYIHWSWFWVLAPTWVATAIALITIVVFILIASMWKK